MYFSIHRFLAIVLVMLFINHYSLTQEFVDNIKKDTLDSEYLNEKREILLYTTNKGEFPNDFPTIYLLDGSRSFLLAIGIIENLRWADKIPDVNLVGINNFSYDREFNLTTKDTTGNENVYFESGGLDNFRNFFNHELQPKIGKEISTSNYNIIIGHSLGGLFALHLHTVERQLIKSQILIDPSIWWNDAEILKMYAKSKESFNVPTYFGRSLTSSENMSNFEKLTSYFVDIQVDKELNENHISVVPQSIFKGLNFIFTDYQELVNAYYSNSSFSQLKKKLYNLNQTYNTSILPNASILAPRARSLSRDGNYIEALEILNYLESHHPENIMVLNFLGETFQKKGEKQKAIEIYNRSLKIAQAKKSPMIRWITSRIKELDN